MYWNYNTCTGFGVLINVDFCIENYLKTFGSIVNFFLYKIDFDLCIRIDVGVV